MNGTKAVCPHCLKEVVFIDEGEFNRCPDCGTRYRLELRRIADGGGRPASGGGSVLGMVAKVVLIMAGLVVVAVAVLFAGCMIVLTSHH